MCAPGKTKGFMILRKVDDLLNDYHQTELVINNIESLNLLREAFSFVDPNGYRGVYRQPLESWDDDYPEQDNIEARKKFTRIVGKERNKWILYRDTCYCNKELIDSLEDAMEIHSHLENPPEYEIIEVVRDDFGTEYDFLGFEVGYWAGDHFSLICDLVIMPQWHPPICEDFQELKEYLLRLNENCLFPDVKAAENLRDYYLTKSWAETESYPCEFCIIQMSKPKIT
jgi:hypothetical protein